MLSKSGVLACPACGSRQVRGSRSSAGFWARALGFERYRCESCWRRFVSRATLVYGQSRDGVNPKTRDPAVRALDATLPGARGDEDDDGPEETGPA